MNYRAAQANCRFIMGPNGHLAEPYNTEEHDKIRSEGKKAFGTLNYNYNREKMWIGIDQIGRNGSESFLYASTRRKPTVIGRGYENKLRNDNKPNQHAYCAVLEISTSNNHVSQTNCDENRKSVCQARYP